MRSLLRLSWLVWLSVTVGCQSEYLELPECETDPDCGAGFECVQGQCEPVTQCQDDQDCPASRPICDTDTGRCVACNPQCTGRCCSDNGCGGTCPDLCSATGQTCNPEACTCEGACQPDCQGRSCGPDKCGGTCPPGCQDTEFCAQDGSCVCAPQCQDRECGDDGCGSTCGSCAADLTCNDLGRCVEDHCVKDCAGRACGPDPVCGESCGDCPADHACNPAGVCVCVPETCGSLGAECGRPDDGCGAILDCGHCPHGLVCGAGGLPHVCDCPVVGEGTVLTVDVPTVALTIDVTLNGQALTTANSAGDDEATLYLVDTVTGDWVRLYSTWHDTDDLPNYPHTFSVLAGTYDVHYRTEDAGTHWPSNYDAVLMEGLDLTSDRTVTVDVPTVQATFDVTLNGQNLTAANSAGDDEATLYLIDATTGDWLRLYSTWHDTDDLPNYPHTFSVLAGTYDVHYRTEDTGTHWPGNYDAVLMKGLDLTSDRTVTVDVRTVQAVVDVTLNGQALTEANSAGDDEATLYLVDDTTGDWLRLYSTWHDTDNLPNYPHTFSVLAGTYDVHYRTEDAGTHWPGNYDAVLMKDLDLTTDQAVLVDVCTVQAIFDVTLNGQALTEANSAGDDEATLYLVDAATGDRLRLYSTWHDTDNLPNYPHTFSVLAGTYDVHYRTEDAGTHWPGNYDAILMTDLDLSTDQAVTVDVATVQATFDVTLNGEMLTAANSAGDDEATLYLVDVATGDWMRLYSTWHDTDNLPNYPHTFSVLAGTYDVHYRTEDAGTHWPGNYDAVLLSDLILTSDGAVTVDVPTVQVTFDVTLDGEILTVANCAGNDEATLYLVDSVTGDWLRLYSTWHDTDNLSNYPHTFSVLAGTYDIHYRTEDAGTHWPGNYDAMLGCVAVQSKGSDPYP